MLSFCEGFKRENPFFDMKEYKNGKYHFHLSPEQRKASRLENENEAKFFGTDECNNYMPF